MNNRHEREVLALSTAMRWLDCVEEDEADDDVDRSLRRAIRIHIRELKYRSGISQPYTGDLDRLYKLQQGMRSLDSVYDFIGEVAGDAVMLPAEVHSLLMFMGHIATDSGWVIRVTEEQYPQWADYFAADRKMYADWQQGLGPLAGSPWEFDDEAAL
jgi:hypothetical protein